MITRWLVAATTAATLAAAAGCNSSEPSAEPGSTRPSADSATTNARTAAERNALAAYTGMWQAVAEAGEVPDPDAPKLRQYAADRALARLVDVLFTYRETGVATRGRPTSHPRVTSANPAETPTEVAVDDCGDSTNWTKHKKATGELIKDDPRGRRHITAVVKVVDGTWKIVSFEAGNIGTC